MKSSLFHDLHSAGVQIDSHESDLYCPTTPEARAILARHPREARNATTFLNQRPPNVGELWFDVPFAFLPFWEARQPKAKSNL